MGNLEDREDSREVRVPGHLHPVYVPTGRRPYDPADGASRTEHEALQRSIRKQIEECSTKTPPCPACGGRCLPGVIAADGGSHLCAGCGANFHLCRDGVARVGDGAYGFCPHCRAYSSLHNEGCSPGCTPNNGELLPEWYP